MSRRISRRERLTQRKEENDFYEIVGSLIGIVIGVIGGILLVVGLFLGLVVLKLIINTILTLAVAFPLALIFSWIVPKVTTWDYSFWQSTWMLVKWALIILVPLMTIKELLFTQSNNKD